MQKRWLLAACLLGLFAGSFVWWWPDRPLWRRTSDSEGYVLGFGPNHQTVYTVHGFRTGDLPPSSLLLHKWDAATGEVLSSVPLAFAGDDSAYTLQLSPDGTTLVHTGTEWPKEGREFEVSFFYDTSTGEQRAGPIAGSARFSAGAKTFMPCAFSSDSRWYWVQHWAGDEDRDGLHIIETATGKSILRLPNKKEYSLRDCCFAPDGNALAVHYCKEGNDVAEHFVQIVELPTGKERCWFRLPDGDWKRLLKWAGSRVYAEVVQQGPTPGDSLDRIFSFDLAAETIGEGREEPLLRGNDDGTTFVKCDIDRGWLVRIQQGPRPKTLKDELLDRLDQTLGTWFRVMGNRDQDIGEMDYATLRFVDPVTGRFLHQISIQAGSRFTISADGKRVASTKWNGDIELWDADPRSRWPLAVAAGLLVAFPVLAFGRRRLQASRRHASSSAAMETQRE